MIFNMVSAETEIVDINKEYVRKSNSEYYFDNLQQSDQWHQNGC